MKLNEERLGIAFVRGNKWEWDDEVLGPKPDGFDKMTHDEKWHFLTPKLNAIQFIIGISGANKAWWKYELHRSEDEWRDWFFSDRCIGLSFKTVETYIKGAK